MSLAILFRLPETPSDIEEFLFSNRDEHSAIAAAIKRKYGVDIVPYSIYPVTEASMRAFLLGHQVMHVQEASLLGVDSQDFLDNDIASWWEDHATQHRLERAALGM